MRQNGVGLTRAKSQSRGAGASVTTRLRSPGWKDCGFFLVIVKEDPRVSFGFNQCLLL